MSFQSLFLIVGTLLIAMAVSESMLKRLPLTTSMLYLFVGLLLGPFAAGMLRLDPLQQSTALERLAEASVIISLFSAGLKLRLSITDPGWRPAIRLATLSMVVTITLLTLAGLFLLNLPLGAAVLLGAVLAPTDPVLDETPLGEGDWHLWSQSPTRLKRPLLQILDSQLRCGILPSLLVLLFHE